MIFSAVYYLVTPYSMSYLLKYIICFYLYSFTFSFKVIFLPGPKTLFLDRYYFHRRHCVCVCVCLSVCESLPRLSQKVLDRFWWNLAGWFIMIKDRFLSKMSLIGPLRRKLGTIWIFGEDNMWLTKYQHFLNRHLSMIKRQSVYVGPLHSKPTLNHRGLCWQTKDNNQTVSV